MNFHVDSMKAVLGTCAFDCDILVTFFVIGLASTKGSCQSAAPCVNCRVTDRLSTAHTLPYDPDPMMFLTSYRDLGTSRSHGSFPR